MDFLKAFFKDGPLTYEQLEAAVKEAKLKVVDLSKGGYVSEAKHSDEMKGLQSQISALTGQITQRDGDIATLRTSLEAAQADAGKLSDVQQTLTNLQAKYADDKSQYEKRIADQRYEFMVKEKANSLHFSSTAAKRAFIQEAIGKGFKVDGENLMGYEDFLSAYKKDDPGAFAAETPPADNSAPSFTLPGSHSAPPAKHRTLSELMKMKNENPDMEISFNN